MEPSSNLLLAIYRAAREMPTNEFQDFVLSLVRSFIPFDSSRWATVELIGRRATTHCAHLINEPTDIVLDWDSINRLDKLMHTVVTHPGNAYSIHTDSYYAGRELAQMRDYTQRYQHANSLCIALHTTTPQHIEGLTLFRARQENHFNPQNQHMLEQLMPHMVEALTVNRVLTLSLAGIAAPAPERTATALSGINGQLHYAGSEFIHLLRQEWPDWYGPSLPKTLLQALARKGSTGFTGAAIAVTFTRLGDLLFLKASRLSRLQQLSPREMTVAQLFGAGRSYKEISQQLDIAPTTVRNLLQRIYAKLGIGDKAELAALIAGK